jgi:hypothetical protein
MDGMNEADMARTILADAVKDACRQAVGIPLSRQVAGDTERVVEIIGEAQWFLLDDADEDEPFSYHWCCWAAELDADSFRNLMHRRLRKERVLLPRPERYRLAELAGKRRLRIIRTKNKDHSVYTIPVKSLTD